MEAPHSSRLRVAARPREIRGLDGLRALAIAAVLVFHLRPASLQGWDSEEPTGVGRADR